MSIFEIQTNNYKIQTINNLDMKTRIILSICLFLLLSIPAFGQSPESEAVFARDELYNLSIPSVPSSPRSSRNSFSSDLGSEIGSPLGTAIGNILGALIFGSPKSNSLAPVYYDSRGIPYSSAKAANAANMKYEREQRFNQGKQDLLANLIGMPQKTSTPLEMIGRKEISTNSLPLTIGMRKKPASDLELIVISPSQSSPSDIVIDDTKGLPSVNYRPSGVIAPEIDNDKEMKIAGFEDDIQSALRERDEINRYCDTYPFDCEAFQKRKEELEKQIGSAKHNLYNLKTDEYNSKIEGYKQQLADYDKQLSECQNEFCRNQIQEAKESIKGMMDNASNKFAELKKNIDNFKSNDYGTDLDKREKIADMRLKRIDDQVKDGEITIDAGLSMAANVQAEKIVIDGERKVADVYNEVSSFTAEKKAIAKDVYENPKAYLADERVYKPLQHLGVDVVTTASSVLPVAGQLVMGQYNSMAHQYIDNGQINQFEATKDHLQGIVIDKAIEQIPYASRVQTAVGLFGRGWDVFKAVDEKGQDRIQNKQTTL